MSAKALLFLLLALSLTSGAAASDYYVSATLPQASDANPGSLARPFKTISRAARQAHGGDTIWIMAGSYRETVEIPHGGSGTKTPLTIRSMPGARVELKGSDLVTSWSRQGSSIWKKTGWTVNSQQVFVDGHPLQQIGANCPLSQQSYQGKPYLPVVGKGLADLGPGTFWYDAGAHTLYIRLAGDGDPNAHTVEASVRNFIIPPGPAGQAYGFIELRDLNFLHSNQTGQGYNMGMVNVWGRNWVVTGCTFTYGDFTGLNVVGENHLITHNVCNHNGAVGINLNGSDEAHGWRHYSDRPPQHIVLTGNETSYNNYRHFYMHWHAGGLRAAASCNFIQVSEHRAQYNRAPGIWFDGWCRNISINRCLVAHNEGAGIFYEISDHAVIANNVVVGNRAQGIYAAAADGVRIFNNTLDQNWAGIALHGMPRPEHPSLKNNRIRNNIISDSTWADLVIYTNPATATGNNSDYNLYHRSDGTARFCLTASPSYDLTATQLKPFAAASGLEQHGRQADPLWVNRSRGDYALKPGSPAIDAGTNEVPGIENLDFAGQKRIAAGPGSKSPPPVIDIGAYEYQ